MTSPRRAVHLVVEGLPGSTAVAAITSAVRCPSCRATYRAGFSFCPLDGARLVGDEVDPLLGAVIAGRYRIDRLLGVGSFGRVYEARHLKLSRRFAVKLPSDEAAWDTKQRQRFFREAEAASRLSHPHVVGVVDVGETEGRLAYLVMDLAPGEPLDRMVARRGQLPRGTILRILRQMLDGLTHAHDRGLVHRDLKPGNVMVELDGDREHVRIVDFGLAIIDPHGSGDRLTTVGTVLGTPAYLAPEQAIGGAIDHRTDLYGLGVMLYEMLSGTVPFTGSAVEIATQHVHEPPPRIARSDIDPLLEALAFWLMEKRPEARPQHACHVLELLDQIEHSPGAARERLRPWLTPASFRRPVPTARTRGAWELLDHLPTERAPVTRSRPRLPWLWVGAAGVVLAAVLTYVTVT